MSSSEKKEPSDMLVSKLGALAVSDMYPFHMPGHKRNSRFMNLPAPVQLDITEIDDFDNLHHAQGIIAQAQERAARMTGAGHTWFLVNGSTCGLLSAIFACTQRGGRILVARNCHKAVYNAIELQGLHPIYVYPKVHEVYGIYEGVDAGEVERLLVKYKDIQAVVITSPTYEGVISDILAIAEKVHAHGIPLIVDEAHGAHLGYSPRFEQSAVRSGADLVIQSLHKTLPSMTQTAVLHLCGLLVDAAKVQKFLAVFESSSPSYVMMAGMDACMALLERDGTQLFYDYAQRLEMLRQQLGGLKHIRLLGKTDLCEVPGSRFDISKLVLFVCDRRGMGPWLYRQLRECYHLQMEMASADYVLAMTSFCDTDQGFERLYQALSELDEKLEMAGNAGKPEKIPDIPVIETPWMCSSEAAVCAGTCVPLMYAKGRICKEYLYAYPPGVPFVVPGEIIDRKILDVIARYQKAGLSIQGAADETLAQLCVVAEDENG